MPKRLLRDWTDSVSVNRLTVQGERFFVRLVMKADDFGLLTGDVRLLRALLFPLLIDSVREADISRWIAECEKAGLIVLYEVEGKVQLVIRNFGQRIRSDAKPRHPLPSDYESTQKPLPPEPAAGRGGTRRDAALGEGEGEGEGEGGSRDAAASPRGSAGVPIPVAIDTPAFRKKWLEWLDFRKSNRKAVSEKAAKKQLADCESWGVRASIASIEHSIKSDYQGLFQPKGEVADKVGRSRDGIDDMGCTDGSHLTNDDLRRMAEEVAGAA